MTQKALNICFATERNKAENRLKRLYNEIEERLSNKEKGDLARSQDAWLHYMKLNCTAEAALYEGGSIVPSTQSACEFKMIEDREIELHRIYDNARPKQ